MKHTITLPENCTRVMTDEIPLIIAKAITPENLANTPKITAIRKRQFSESPYVEETGYDSIPSENLTDSDWKYLNHLCGLSGLPPLIKGGELIFIEESEWELYEKAFEEYKLKWNLLPFSNTVLKTVADAHSKYLTNAIIKNDVVVYDNLTHLPLHGPTKLTALKNTYIHRNAFIEYVAKYDLKVLEDNGKSILKKIPVLKQQDEAILNWLIASGYNPKELPKCKNGLSGIKKECRDALTQYPLFSTDSIFNTAWQRLRDNDEIIDVK